jgi:hypothetical protein
MIDELEKLLADIEPDELMRDVLREEHRQLEKDLLRLVDPLPPSNFFELVMTRVSKESPLPSRREMIFAGTLVTASLAAAAAIFISTGMPASRIGMSIASAAVAWRESFVGLQSAFSVIWKTSALPVALGLVATLISGSLMLRKMLPSKETV